jgi:hypothetical protein
MAEFEKRLACVIKADGGIARGYLIDTCKCIGVNEYIITWKIPLQGEAKTNFAGTIGNCTVDEKVEPGFITVGLTSDPKQMRVQTHDASGKPAARSFHIAAFGINRASSRQHCDAV